MFYGLRTLAWIYCFYLLSPLLEKPMQVWWLVDLGMKTDGNRRENPAIIPVSVFYYGKRERERNSRVHERKQDITVTEIGGNWKIYRNALLFNHHSLSMNITLDTPLHNLFFKNMINVFCFIRLNRNIYILMLRNMYWCWETWEDIWCAYLFFSRIL